MEEERRLFLVLLVWLFSGASGGSYMIVPAMARPNVPPRLRMKL